LGHPVDAQAMIAHNIGALSENIIKTDINRQKCNGKETCSVRRCCIISSHTQLYHYTCKTRCS